MITSVRPLTGRMSCTTPAKTRPSFRTPRKPYPIYFMISILPFSVLRLSITYTPILHSISAIATKKKREPKIFLHCKIPDFGTIFAYGVILIFGGMVSNSIRLFIPRIEGKGVFLFIWPILPGLPIPPGGIYSILNNNLNVSPKPPS